MEYKDLGSVTTTVSTSATLIATIDVREWQYAGLDISNSGAALNSFAVRVMPGASSAEIPILDTSADFADPLKHPVMLVEPSNVFTLASGANIAFELWVLGYSYIKLYGSVASGTSDVTVRGILK